jgi:dipeptide/tripeptide permease
MKSLDILIYGGGAALFGAFVFIVWSYARGLRGSPRELFILFFSKIIEYSAYSAMNLTFVLYLSADCGLGDIAAGSYIGVFSTGITLATMLVGAVVDAVGVKKTLVFGAGVLVVSRLALPFCRNVYLATLVGFFPLAIGIAILLPVLSVGIKRYTTKEGAALGFAMFYTLMNVGHYFGATIFDGVRATLGEHTIVTAPLLGVPLSTYQVIFLIGFALSVPNLVLMLLMRDGVEMTDDRGVVIRPAPPSAGNILVASWRTMRTAAVDTGRIFREVFRERAFWRYLLMLGLLVFVRLVFYHFHYTFPKYGIRVLGPGLPIGHIYSALNPAMIVFLVPLLGWLTRKTSSYKVMMIGTWVSALSVFIAVVPARLLAPLRDTWVGELIFVRWLHIPEAQRNPLFLTLIAFVIVFTVGEALWSPRLMQFTAEIAPKGREGSYISLSYLPYFAAKPIVGVMSGWLLQTYVPKDAPAYPHHWMIWLWIGGMALISPLALVVFRKMFRRAEQPEAAH